MVRVSGVWGHGKVMGVGGHGGSMTVVAKGVGGRGSEPLCNMDLAERD